MPSTYTLNNGIELIGTGEQSGTWGDTTNINFQLVDTALDGQVSISLTSTGTSGSPNLLEISDGATSSGRNRLVIFTGTPGAADADVFVRLDPNDAEKIIYVRNDLGGTRTLKLFQGTYSASNDYEVPAGTTAVVFFNGAGTGAVAANVFNNAFFDSLRLGSVSVDKILDEDNMASDDAAALATQQSIKAYVDSQVGTVDTLAEILANGNTTGGTNVLFGDNDKAIFGAGSDLQIWHNATAGASYIEDAGAGNLRIKTNGAGVEILNSADLQLAFFNNSSGEAVLKHINAGVTTTRLNTTSTGVNIVGTAVTDGVTVDGNLSVDGGTIKLDGNYPVGTGNVALGNQAGDALASGGNYNVALGSAALSAVTTGDQNVAIGNGALQVSTASSNTAIGYLAGGSLTTGSSNVALGVNALNDMVSGANNTVVGKQAGDALGDEIVATAIVSGVSYTIQTLGTTDFTLIGASSNTVGGTFTATGAGSGTGTASANANYNTFVGHQSGDVIVGGSKNSILGRFDGNQNTIDIRNSDNNIVLSDGDGNPRLAYVSANTELVINEQSADVDFRVESDTNANILFIDAGNDRLKVGSNDTSGAAIMSVYDSRDNSASNWFSDRTGLELYNSSQPAGYGTSVGIFLEAHSGESAYMYSEAPSNSNVTGYIGARTSGTNNRDMISWTPTSVTINDDSYDADFRVESDTNTHALFVDAGADHVSIGTSSDFGQRLNVNGGIGLATDPTVTWTSNYLKFQTRSASVPVIEFLASASGNYAPRIDVMNGSGTVQHRIDAGGATTFNETGADNDFRVEGSGNTNMIFVDASADRVMFGGATNVENSRVGVLSDKTTSGIGIIQNQLGVTDTSDMAAGVGGGVTFNGRYLSSGGFTNFGSIEAKKSDGTSGQYGGQVVIKARRHGGNNEERISFDQTATVVNQDGHDNDFRVESDSNANAIFMNAGNGTTAFGTTTDNYNHASNEGIYLSPGSSSSMSANSPLLRLNRNGTGGNDRSNIEFYNNGTIRGWIGSLGAVDGIFLYAQGSNGIHIRSDEVVVNENSANLDFRVESDSQANMLKIDAGLNTVIIGGGEAVGDPYFSLQGETNNDAGEIKVRSNGYNAFKFRNASNANVGSIRINASSTSYFTTSDRRLKTDIQAINDATDRLMAMNPVSHKWIAEPDADAVVGFIAQEMEGIIPEAVSGESDAEDMMGMDYGRITPVIVAALQEAITKIETLEAKVTALENA